MVSAIYPGTFDPVHNGHVDIASRASKLFDRLLIAVYDTPPTTGLLPTEERVGLFESAVAQLDNVDVASFTGLVPELARQVGAKFIVRGLRAGLDFETEFEMALMWRNLDPGIDVVSMMSALQYQFVYASRIKEVAQLGGDVRSLVPSRVASELRSKFNLGPSSDGPRKG
jgi:pantetheine-phosphate adenylyltransferase